MIAVTAKAVLEKLITRSKRTYTSFIFYSIPYSILIKQVSISVGRFVPGKKIF
jgi:hypothetical protein